MLAVRPWKLAILMVLVLLAGCSGTRVVLPYVAQVKSVEPGVANLKIRATAGGGGELEIVNHTGQQVILLDEQGDSYVRITPDGVFHRSGGTWSKTKDTPVYYCHDPRIVYEGPEPASGEHQVVKQWEITGLVDEQEFVVRGQTMYVPRGRVGVRLGSGAVIPALVCVGILAVGVLLFALIRTGPERISS